MRKFTFLAILMAGILFFGGGINAFGQSNSDKTIVLLTDPAHGGDLALTAFLTNNGFNVSVINVTDAMIGSPTPEFQAQLDAADVIVYGRDAWSNVQNAVDATIAPVIHTNTFGAQWGSPDQFWFLNASMNVQSGLKFFKINVTDDPIFANSNVVGGELTYATEAAFVATTDAHNGTVIGDFGGDAGIVRFAKGVPYNSDAAAKIPNSDHTLFPFQTGPSSMTISPDAQAAFYAEILRMAGLPIAAPAYIYYSPKNIVLLTDPAHGGDLALNTFLTNNGLNVTTINVTDDMIGTPTPEFQAQLDAADVIVYGRDAWSNLQNAVDATITPVIHTNTFGAQWGSPDQFWFLNASMNVQSGPKFFKINVTDDPIFANSNVAGGELTYATEAAFVTTTDAHNGTVIGDFGGDAGIVRFAKGVPYNSDAAAKIPNSDHTLFPMQTGPSSMTLSPDAQAALYAEILRMAGLPIAAPTYVYYSPKKIVLLTDPAHGGDLALNTFLTNNGLNVTSINVTDAMIGTPTPAFQAQLDAADVIVYGRDAWSGVQNAVDATITPVIHTNTFGAQWGSPDQFWFLNASMNVQSNPEYFKINVTDDPIFANSNVAGGELTYATEAAFVTTTDPHNGTVIGDFGGDAGIVRFAKGVPYNSDAAAKIPNSDHTLFPFQTGPSSMTISPDAQAALYAEILRMAGLPITAPAYYYYNNSLDTIVLLTDPAHGNDDAQFAWLQGNGFIVSRVNIGSEVSLIDPTQETLDMLNAADLVIAGRDAFSSAYDGNGQDVLDNLTVPVITDNPYGAQWGQPKMWYPDGAVSDVVTDSLWIKVDKTDPIFTYCMVAGDSVLMYASQDVKRLIGSTTTGGAHNGMIVGQIGNDTESGLVLVRFAKDVPYNTIGGSKIPKGERTIFAWESGPKSWTLSHDGQTAYYAEIFRLLGNKIQAPAYYYHNPSSVSSLSDLTVSIGKLDPAFSPTETSYTLVVPEGTTSVTLTATTTDPNATVEGDGVITDLPTTAFITVTAEDGVTITDYAVDITTDVAVSNFKQAGLKIYPNPVRDNVMIEGLASGARVHVMNAKGQIVSRTEADSKNMQLNLGQLKSGIYLMKVEIDGKSYTTRFIKQ